MCERSRLPQTSPEPKRSLAYLRLTQFQKSRCLFAFRHVPACLCLASLLFSNVAGWLHIGCVESTAGCCGDSSIQLIDRQPDHHRCCDHGHGRLGHNQDAAQDPSSAGTPVHQEDCPEEHDSESCSICQSFFSLRNASSTALPLPTVFSEAREITSFIAVCSCKRTILSDSISVRGPPRV